MTVGTVGYNFKMLFVNLFQILVPQSNIDKLTVEEHIN